MPVLHAVYDVYAVSHTAFPEQYDGISPKTLYVPRGEQTELLTCTYRPGRARSLYHVTWVRRLSTTLNNPPSSPHQSVSAGNYSLFLVADETDVKVDGISYQCFVDVTSCSGACSPPGPLTLSGAEVIVQILGKWVSTCSRDGERNRIVTQKSRVWLHGCVLPYSGKFSQGTKFRVFRE